MPKPQTVGGPLMIGVSTHIKWVECPNNTIQNIKCFFLDSSEITNFYPSIYTFQLLSLLAIFQQYEG